MYRSLVSQGLICRQADVRRIIKSIDPDGVTRRQRRRLHRRKYISQGPNFVWHIDGHDKLKPFGFSIHGCLDGFSRKVMWLEVGPTNKMPEIVAKYYLDTVKKIGGIPMQIKADDGTEHALIEPIHILLRNLDADDEEAMESFSIITSPQNQRIEAYWSILQRDRIGWWRRFLRDISDMDLFSNDDPVLVDCIRFCFMELIRNDLNSIRTQWNSHIISKSRNAGPRGRPDSMFYLSHLFEAENMIIKVDAAEINEFYSDVTANVLDYSEEFQDFATTVMHEEGKGLPQNPTEALDLYLFLLQKINEYS